MYNGSSQGATTLSLSDNPHLGRPFDLVLEGLRKLTVGRHLILYFPRDTHMDIIRILHQSMDIERHFDDL
ncbi:MAG: type II toxin-antitoxin system RelE/ParE family toxin [Opitutales bacterium]|nr:type II toxin-antitoxin system RelE/ParE family toxin [Opitutales bacterium]